MKKIQPVVPTLPMNGPSLLLHVVGFAIAWWSPPAFGAGSEGAGASAAQPIPPAWKAAGSLAVRESYDGNVFLQDVAPDPAIAQAVAPRVQSLVTTIAASVVVRVKRFPLDDVTAT